MRKDQVEYFRGRVATITAERRKKIEESHLLPAKKISSKERADLVRSGKVKLHANVETISIYDDVAHVFDFSKHIVDAHLTAEGERLVSVLQQEAASVLDAAILGDESIALERLEKFAGKKR